MYKPRFKVLIFANTLWFINNFKIPLLDQLRQNNYEVDIIYLRLGPKISDSQKNYLISNSSSINSFSKYIFKYLINLIKFRKTHKPLILFSFTIGPIFLSLMPPFFKIKRFATLEGLGRVFSSRILFYRILKRIIQIFYKFIFKKFYKGIFVLNYSDYAYLLENKIASISKLFIIPGTGINSEIYNPKTLYKKRLEIGLINKDNQKILNDKLFITFMGRLTSDKGFYRFLAAITYLINDNKYKDLRFRVVAPKSDLDCLDFDLKKFLIKNNVQIEEYSTNPINFYANSNIIVIPSTYGEGLSRVALEAGFLGVPIAAVQNRGLTSLFIDGILGETTTDTEPYGISMLIKKILDNYDEYSKLPENTFKNLCRKYDNEVSASSVVNVVESIVKLNQ